MRAPLWLRPNRWSRLTQVVAGLVVATVVCGMVGYSNHIGKLRESPRELVSSPSGLSLALDLLYLSLKLLWLGSDTTWNDTWLIVGRWTGALCAFFAVVNLLTPYLEGQYRELRLANLRGHTVIVGLSEKGKSFLRDACKTRVSVGIDVQALDPETLLADPKTRPTLVVDPKKHDQEVAIVPPLLLGLEPSAKEAFIIHGDATKAEVLRHARVDRADRVILATRDDVMNLAIATEIAVLKRSSEPHVTEVVVHIADPLLRLDGVSAINASEGVPLRAFSVPALAARQLLAAHPFTVEASIQGAPGAHVVFIGFDGYAEEILLQAVRMGALADQTKPRITIFTAAAEALKARLARNYPALRDLVEALDVRSFDPDAALADEDLAAVEGTSAEHRVTAVVVTASSDSLAVVLARRVHEQKERFGRWPAPIFVRLDRPADFAPGLVPIALCHWLSRVIEPFGALSQTCCDSGLRDWHEGLAKEIHLAYQSSVKGKPGTRTAARSDWKVLDESYREADRRAVDHLPVRLASLGLVMRDEPPVLRERLRLEPQEKEALARLEHSSWAAQKSLSGWRHGARRDSRRKLHEALVPFDELGPTKAKDFDQIEAVFDLLAEPAKWLPHQGNVEPHPQTIFRERIIGLAGHNVLAQEDAEEIIKPGLRALLKEMNAQNWLTVGGEFWTFVTPLAPGADLVLADAVLKALTELLPAKKDERRYRMIVAQSLPFDELAAAYLAQKPPPGSTLDGKEPLERFIAATHQREEDPITAVANLLDRFVAETEACELVVQPPSPGLAGGNEYLLSRCDELIAFLDGSHYGESSPFAIASWRSLPPDRFPPYGTGALVHAWLQRTNAAPRRLASILSDGLRVLEPARRSFERRDRQGALHHG